MMEGFSFMLKLFCVCRVCACLCVCTHLLRLSYYYSSRATITSVPSPLWSRMQSAATLGGRYSKLILISAQRHQMISFPSWHNTEGCRDCISTAEPCRPTAPTYLRIPPSARVNCDLHVRVYTTSRNDLNDKERKYRKHSRVVICVLFYFCHLVPNNCDN